MKWSASRPGRFKPGERARLYPLEKRLGEPQCLIGHFGGEKSMIPVKILSLWGQTGIMQRLSTSGTGHTSEESLSLTARATEFFSFPKQPSQLWVLNPSPIKWISEVLSGVKRLRIAVTTDLPQAPSLHTNKWICTSTTSMSYTGRTSPGPLSGRSKRVNLPVLLPTWRWKQIQSPKCYF